MEFNFSISVDVKTRPKRFLDCKFYAGIHPFDVEQRENFIQILLESRLQSEPYCVFLSGGAGVGNSHVDTMLYQALERELLREPGVSPGEIRVLLCVPTGKAAFNIQGSSFRISTIASR